MGKKKSKGEYNDFLEDTRYQNNNDSHNTSQPTPTLTRSISPPAPSQAPQHPPKKPQLTHFLCLPIVTSANRPQLTTALSTLRSDLPRLAPDVPPTAVRPVSTLHLTIGVMSLSAAQLASATAYLANLDVAKLLRGITTQAVAAQTSDSPSVSENGGAVANPALQTAALGGSAAAAADPETLDVRLRGLRCMQKEREARVLYVAPEDATGRLESFVESLRKGFEEGGWMECDERGVKLHVTVLNMIYAKGRGRGRGKGVPRFDARGLVEAYEGFVWAEGVRVDRVRICEMGAKKVRGEEGEVVDEEYEVVAEKRI